jgi:hypothetical protein
MHEALCLPIIQNLQAVVRHLFMPVALRPAICYDHVLRDVPYKQTRRPEVFLNKVVAAIYPVVYWTAQLDLANY